MLNWLTWGWYNEGRKSPEVFFLIQHEHTCAHRYLHSEISYYILYIQSPVTVSAEIGSLAQNNEN